MNKQDSDVIELIDVATHLGYFGLQRYCFERC